MRNAQTVVRSRATLVILVAVLFVATAWAATETTLHRFNPNGADAVCPLAAFIMDSAGNLYGTSNVGGSYNVGIVFELSPANGSYVEKVLYSFRATGTDGTEPYGGLIMDASGNLYGTTSSGGLYGEGTVFELVPSASGTWMEKIIHNFKPSAGDGTDPRAGLIFDAAGNLYSTTVGGGAYGGGTVFELTPTQGGGWTGTVLYSFGYNGSDGANPYAGVIFDSAGNLYGTTNNGGTYGAGTVFELSPSGHGNWTESILYNFTGGADGANPYYANLVLDHASNLYGTTLDGGASNNGTVFELTPSGGGNWTEQVLHSFNNNGTDGVTPYGGLIIDSAGNLYGTTYQGGTYYWGTAFELSPAGGGNWTEKVLHNFDYTDGALLFGALIFDSAGNLYSNSTSGGTYNAGTAFELTPSGGGNWTARVLHSYNFAATDGANPSAALLMGSTGNLYGTTSDGGRYDDGTVFEITPSGTESILYNFGNGATDGVIPLLGSLIMDSAGNLYGTTIFGGGAYEGGTVFELSPTGIKWTERILHSFTGTDGFRPFGGLVFDRSGNLYGTTYYGGTHNLGTVFELMPAGGGNWTERVLHSFNLDGTDGILPEAGLIFDGAGNLYGTTLWGGSNYFYGTVFELSPAGGGNWTEQVIHSFSYNGTDGSQPQSALVFDAAGNLYGTTTGGGSYGGGTVFELSRSGGGWAEQIPYNFGSAGDGSDPQAGVVLFGASANLYGTTAYGGAYGGGTVFELTPTGGGNWVETVLRNFNPLAFDGTSPQCSLIFDNSGNHLYGTTYSGGGVYNAGTVFEIGP